MNNSMGLHQNYEIDKQIKSADKLIQFWLNIVNDIVLFL